MSITIRKIAKDLQLAVSTVSKALSDSYEISAETKRRVLEYAEKIDYVPNLYASTLKQRKSNNIAVVIPEVADSFFSAVINGIESVAQTKGYHVIVYLTHEDLKKEESILRDFRGGRVDGVLISVSGGAKRNSPIHDLSAKKFPLVFFDRACEEVEAAKVLTNDYESGYKATQHLIEKGCKKIAFLATAEDLEIINLRRKGYEDALRDHRLKSRREFILRCSNSEEDSYSLIHKMLCKKDRPDGIVGSIEKLTTLTYAICHDLKLKIPRDVKIIGFSNLPFASLLNPSLTTITQPAFEMGRTATILLFNILENKKGEVPNQRIILPSSLMERSSTK
ncbi:MAG: LacI family DNA-binding transcriptional regulator [Chryseolinea sp.]